MTVVRSSGYKRGIMKLSLLGYLCVTLYVGTTPTADCHRADLGPAGDSDGAGFTETYYGVSHDNCTQCNTRPELCHCSSETGSCLVCCLDRSDSDIQCCYCYDCELCWHEQRRWHLLTITQISVSILFGFGILGLIIIYCRICNKTRQIARERRAMLQQEQEMAVHCSTIEGGMRERPPPYSEVCNAPPIFTSSRNGTSSLLAILYNRACMQEAPPSYPESPKLQERTRASGEPLPAALPSPTLNSIRHM